MLPRVSVSVGRGEAGAHSTSPDPGVQLEEAERADERLAGRAQGDARPLMRADKA